MWSLALAERERLKLESYGFVEVVMLTMLDGRDGQPALQSCSVESITGVDLIIVKQSESPRLNTVQKTLHELDLNQRNSKPYRVLDLEWTMDSS